MIEHICFFPYIDKSVPELSTEEIPGTERKPTTCVCFYLETTGLGMIYQ